MTNNNRVYCILYLCNFIASHFFERLAFPLVARTRIADTKATLTKSLYFFKHKIYFFIVFTLLINLSCKVTIKKTIFCQKTSAKFAEKAVVFAELLFLLIYQSVFLKTVHDSDKKSTYKIVKKIKDTAQIDFFLLSLQMFNKLSE